MLCAGKEVGSFFLSLGRVGLGAGGRSPGTHLQPDNNTSTHITTLSHWTAQATQVGECGRHPRSESAPIEEGRAGPGRPGRRSAAPIGRRGSWLFRTWVIDGCDSTSTLPLLETPGIREGWLRLTPGRGRGSCAHRRNLRFPAIGSGDHAVHAVVALCTACKEKQRMRCIHAPPHTAAIQ